MIRRPRKSPPFPTRRSSDLAAQDAPWFLFVGPLGPHDPFEVPERFVQLYDPASIPLPPSFTDTLDDKRSEEHTSELQSQSNLVCRLLLEKKKLDEAGFRAIG